MNTIKYILYNNASPKFLLVLKKNSKFNDLPSVLLFPILSNPEKNSPDLGLLFRE